MSKELEALKVIGEIYQHTEEGGYRLYDADKIKNCAKEQFELLLKTLTPPTAEEVCEAIGKFFEIDEYESCLYDVNLKQFVIDLWGRKTTLTWFERKQIRIREYLPPHLITLIGRFYESVVE